MTFFLSLENDDMINSHRQKCLKQSVLLWIVDKAQKLVCLQDLLLDQIDLECHQVDGANRALKSNYSHD